MAPLFRGVRRLHRRWRSVACLGLGACHVYDEQPVVTGSQLEAPPTAAAPELGPMQPDAGAPDETTVCVAIIALACEPPARSGLPVSHWTPTELAREAIKIGIVANGNRRNARPTTITLVRMRAERGDGYGHAQR